MGINTFQVNTQTCKQLKEPSTYDVMGNIQGFILAQSKEIFFICVVGFGIQFWLQHGFCEWPKEINLYSIGYINGYLFISMCILTDLPKRKTLGRYAKGRSSYFYMFLHSHTHVVVPIFMGSPKVQEHTLKLMPKRTHSQGNLPYNFIDQTYFSSKLSNHVTWFHDHE
jgi:hypothetical protein